MTQLETLPIGGTKVTDQGMLLLKPFTELKKISVFDTGVGDEGIAMLANHAKLRTLSIAKSKVTETGIAALKNRCRNCRLPNSHCARGTTNFFGKLSCPAVKHQYRRAFPAKSA